MANGIIPVTPGTGLNLQSYVNTVGGNSVHSEAVTLTDSSGVEKGTTANPIIVAGSLPHNTAFPVANNIGVLSAVASASNPTYAEGNQVLLSTDLAGSLRVNIVGSIVANNNVTEWNSVALGSPSAYGTSPGAVNVIGVNAFVTNFPATQTVVGTVATANAANPTDAEGNPASLSLDLGGNLRSLQYFVDITGANPAATAAAVVAGGFALLLTASDVGLRTTSPPLGGVLKAMGGLSNDMPTPSWYPLPLGPAGQSVIVEGIIGGIPVPISGTVTATVSGPIAVTQSTSPWIVAGGGTAGAPGTAVLTVQGVSGGQAVPISGSVTIAANASVNLTQVAGTALGATAVTNFGTAPAAAAVPGINASLFAGTTGITATGSSINVNITNTVPVSGTIAVTQSTSPWVVSLTSTTITGTVSVTQGTSPWIVAGGGTAGSAAAGVVTVQGIVGGTTLPVTATIAAAQTIAVTNAGTFAVQATISAGSNTIGKVDILGNAGATLDSVAGTPNSQALTIQGNASGVAVPVSGTVTANAGTGTMNVQEVVGTTGGASTSYTNTTGGTASISVKGSAGQIYGYYLDNTANAATSYFQFFNATSATLGTTAPTFVVPVPAGGAANLALSMGIAFGTGIRVGVATTAAGGSAVASATNITVWYN